MDKKQTKHHCTVTFTGVGEARIDNLTQEQAWQIQDVMRLIELKPPNYSENGVLLYSVRTETAAGSQARAAGGGFLARLMRRFGAWAMPLLFVAFLSGQAFAQKAIEPVRVSLGLAAENPSATDLEFNDKLRDEFSRLRLAVTQRRGDYEVTVVTTRMTIEGKPKGYAAAVLIVDARKRFRLSIETAATVLELARNSAQYLDEEFFQKGRR